MFSSSTSSTPEVDSLSRWIFYQHFFFVCWGKLFLSLKSSSTEKWKRKTIFTFRARNEKSFFFEATTMKKKWEVELHCHGESRLIAFGNEEIMRTNMLKYHHKAIKIGLKATHTVSDGLGFETRDCFLHAIFISVENQSWTTTFLLCIYRKNVSPPLTINLKGWKIAHKNSSHSTLVICLSHLSS